MYDQARWHDPSTGQFVSQDPVVTQTLQAYAYASDNPANNSDPTGLCNSPPRVDIKTGADQNRPGHTPVSLTPIKGGTLQAFVNRHYYKSPTSRIRKHPEKRYAPIETHEWRFRGWIQCDDPGHPHDCIDKPNYTGKAGDGHMTFELHVRGASVHCEIPYTSCSQGSPWHDSEDDARDFIKFALTKYCNPENISPGYVCHVPKHSLRVLVWGIGFWDLDVHGPKDHWPELHPVLRITP